jgi:hypothetical protein
MTEVPAGNALYGYAVPDHVAVVSAEAQQAVLLSFASLGVLDEDERSVLRTTGSPTWSPPEAVREALILLRNRAPESDQAAIEQALRLVEDACSTRTGVAIVPPT